MKKEEIEILAQKYKKMEKVIFEYNNLIETQDVYERILNRFENHGSTVIKFISPVGDFKVGSKRDLDKKIGEAIKDIISKEINIIKEEIEVLEYYE